MIHLFRKQILPSHDSIFLQTLPFAIMLPAYECVMEWGISLSSEVLFNFAQYLVLLPVLVIIFFSLAKATCFHGAWEVTFSLHTTFVAFVIYTYYFSIVEFYQNHGFHNPWPQYWVSSVILIISIVAGYFNIKSIKMS